MKQLCKCALIVILAATFIRSLAAQPAENTITTDGGLSVSYPATWSADATGELKVDVSNPDGWLITITIGADANYESSGDAYAPPAEIMRHFVEFMTLTGATIGADTAEAIEIGIIAGLHQTFVTHTDVPFEAVAYVMPDGLSALALVGNQSAPQPITPEIRETFFAVLSSTSFEPTVVEAEAEDVSETAYVPDGTTLISDLEPGVLRFKGGVEAKYPDGWTIYSESDYIQNSVSIIYGEDIFNYRALALITVQDSIDMTVETFRESLMPMSARLYTGRDTFDPEHDIITEQLPDGRVLEYLDLTDANSIRGNIFLVTLDTRYWVWVMLTIVHPEGAEDRIEDVRSMVQDMMLVLPDDAVHYEGFQLLLQDATCDRILTLDDVRESAPYALFNCPAGCADESYSIWGSEIYTLDSSICTSAIHAGAISNANGGLILATWQPGQESYLSTEQNGITTIEYGAWSDSFTVEPFTITDNE